MSGTISGGGFPGLVQVLAGMRQTRQRFDTLTQQASSGLIAGTYAGLGGTAPVVLALGPRIDNLQATQNNIDAAGGPTQVTQTAMKQIQSIASNLLTQMSNLRGVDAAGIDSIAANAKADLANVASLLDSQYGGVYVFAGEDSANPPVPDPMNIGSSGFFTQISGAVGALSVNGAAATAATTLQVAGVNGTSPFSAYMSNPRANLTLPSVSTGEGQSQTIGLLASANIGTATMAAPTTGSYMRDLMRALATVGSMSSGQASDTVNFGALVTDTQTSVIGAITAMSTDVGILGEQQSSLIASKATLSDMSIALNGQLTSARDVDMATTLSNLTLTQTQLQASYQLISTANSMSLVKFMPAS